MQFNIPQYICKDILVKFDLFSAVTHLPSKYKKKDLQKLELVNYFLTHYVKCKPHV